MDYSKLKVAELKEELAKRSLPVSGKKEELVARLVESEGKSKSTANADLGDLAPPEDDYDWDEPDTKTYPSIEMQVTCSAAQPETKPAPAPAPASAKPATAAKQPQQATKPSSESAKSPPIAESAQSTDDALAAELEKRKRRAERFGIPLADSVKSLERAKRFGTTTAVLDESKKQARGKRFGNQVWTKNATAPETKTAGKAKVLDDPVEADKAKKRTERFGGGNEAKKVKT